MSCKEGARISVFVAFGEFCVWLENGAAFDMKVLISRMVTVPRMSVFVVFCRKAQSGRQKCIRPYNFQHFGASGRGVSAYIAFRSSEVESVSVVREREGYAPWVSVNVAFGERPGGSPHIGICIVWRAPLEF